MTYEGVKYKIIRLNTDLPFDDRIGLLRKWCKVFHINGLAPPYDGGTHGNMSFRLSPGYSSFIVTAARSSFAEYLSDDSFFLIEKLDLKNMRVYASGASWREPSSEAMLHGAIYQQRPDVQAILHGHCPGISQYAAEMGIPTTKEFVESGNLKIIKSVIQSLGEHHFLEIKDHGFLSMEVSIEKAGTLAMNMLTKSKLF